MNTTLPHEEDSLHERIVQIVQETAGAEIARLRASAESEEDVRRGTEAILDAVQRAVPEAIRATAVQVADECDRMTRPVLQMRRRDLRAFERELLTIWRPAIDRLEALLQAYIELVTTFFGRGPGADEPIAPHVFAAVSELAARSCRVADEVLCLLKAGHGDGASARWRTLHEVVVVASFIEKHGDVTAERYLLHDALRARKAALAANRFATALGWERVEAAHMRMLEQERAKLVTRFGPAFKVGDYGWAAGAIEKRRNEPVTFADIEAAVDLSRWRVSYGWASSAVHAGTGGLRAAGAPDGDDALLLGPSVFGLESVGEHTALSLAMLASAFVQLRPRIDDVVMAESFVTMSVRCGDAFHEVATREGMGAEDVAPQPDMTRGAQLPTPQEET